MGNKKKIATFLREEAKKLPPEFYSAHQKYVEPQIMEHEGERKLVFGEIGKFPVNHGRRLKRIYTKYGKAGVDKYFSDRGFKLVSKETDGESSAGGCTDCEGTVSE